MRVPKELGTGKRYEPSAKLRAMSAMKGAFSDGVLPGSAMVTMVHFHSSLHQITKSFRQNITKSQRPQGPSTGRLSIGGWKGPMVESPHGPRLQELSLELLASSAEGAGTEDRAKTCRETGSGGARRTEPASVVHQICYDHS